jgi:transmembrane sensor
MSSPHRPDDGAADPLGPDAIRTEEASLWLARRDRGLSAEEQDAYLQWLKADPRNAAALNLYAATLQRMMRLYEWQPAHTAQPNPDLFAPVATKRVWWRHVALAAAAAIVLTLAGWHWHGVTPPEDGP